MRCAKKGCPWEAVAGEPYCEAHSYKGVPTKGYTGGGGGPQDPPIVISGGSVTIEFDDSVFRPLGPGKHANANKKIKRVEISGDGINFAQDTPTGRVVIIIHYGDP
jgi:hypothetical protein